MAYVSTPSQDRIRKTIRLLLAARDMSNRDLGEAIGLSPQGLSDRLNNRTRWTLDNLEAMSSALNVRPSVWFDQPERAMSHLNEVPASDPQPKNLADLYAELGPGDGPQAGSVATLERAGVLIASEAPAPRPTVGLETVGSVWQSPTWTIHTSPELVNVGMARSGVL